MRNAQIAQPMSGAPNQIQGGVQPALTSQVGVTMPAPGSVGIAQTPQAMPMPLPQGQTVMPVPGPPVRQPMSPPAQMLARGLMGRRR